MAHREFREFLAVAEQRGLLQRVQKTVDRNWEPGCLIKWVFQALPEEKRFGIMFDDVDGSEFPLVTGVFGASTEAYALALGVDQQWAERFTRIFAKLKGPNDTDWQPAWYSGSWNSFDLRSNTSNLSSGLGSAISSSVSPPGSSSGSSGGGFSGGGGGGGGGGGW